jgi:hypothetical protein
MCKHTYIDLVIVLVHDDPAQVAIATANCGLTVLVDDAGEARAHRKAVRACRGGAGHVAHSARRNRNASAFFHFCCGLGTDL